MTPLVDAAIRMRHAQRLYFDARRAHSSAWRDLLERSQREEDEALSIANGLEGDELAALVTPTVPSSRCCSGSRKS